MITNFPDNETRKKAMCQTRLEELISKDEKSQERQKLCDILLQEIYQELEKIDDNALREDLKDKIKYYNAYRNNMIENLLALLEEQWACPQL